MVIVDNTWLTEEILNPFDYGTDIVILSLTKYYSASTVIMGACLFADQHIYELCHIYKCITGIHVSPNDASEIIAKLPEMRQRISSSSQLTLDTIAALTSKTTLPISHPSLPSHISYDLANLFFKCNDSGMRLYPSIFTFLLNMSKNRAIKFMKSGQLDYATSYGAAMSRFDPYPTVNNGVTTCRLSIGYGDTLENIMHAFQQFVQP